MSSVREKAKNLPDLPGVYLFKAKNGEIIYVGKARSLCKRVSSYFTRPREIKTAILLAKTCDLDYILTASELDALLLEADLIKKYHPRYNVALRDDKAYPYLKLTIKEAWPRLLLVREKKKDGAQYFGPYQAAMAREIIRLVKKMFPIRWCRETPLKMRAQPCLYHRIGNCAGPCIRKIEPAAYHNLVNGIKKLLKGEFDAVLKKLKTEMGEAASKQDFEQAGELRDRIKLLEKMLEGKNLEGANAPQQMHALSALQKELFLPQIPMRIEAFDVSNLSGTNIVGAMVVFLGGAPLKKDYRKFKIKSVTSKPNDVAGIYEMIKRRFSGTLCRSLSLPDLLLLDGGLPQLHAAERAVAEIGVRSLPMLALAKKEEAIYLPGRKSALKLNKHSPALCLLQRIRDEVHRFAISYHRLKRAKQFFSPEPL